jgi:hypothetical protein
MKLMLLKLMERLGFVPRGTNSVHVFHSIRPVEHAIKWTKGDSNAWHAFRETETWKKLSVMSQDSMIQALLPGSGPYRDDLARQQAFVLGRAMQLEYLAEFSVAPEKPEEQGEDSEFAENE